MTPSDPKPTCHLDAEDYLDAIRHRRGWLFGPLFTSVSGSFLWPEIDDDLVVRRRKRFEMLAWTVSLTLGVVVMGHAVGYYYATRT